MKTLKLLLAAVLCAGGMQGALITSGILTIGQNGPSGSTGESGTLVLSDGVTISNYNIEDGNFGSLCYDYGKGCTYTNSISSQNGFYNYQYLAIGINTGLGAQLFATLDPTFQGYTAVRGVATQTVQMSFTATGQAYKNPPINNSCPFPDFPYTPGFGCMIPVSGSGTVVFTITEYPTFIPGTLDAFYVSGAAYTFTSVPEPATPILITAGIGVFALLRKRYSVN